MKLDPTCLLPAPIRPKARVARTPVIMCPGGVCLHGGVGLKQYKVDNMELLFNISQSTASRSSSGSLCEYLAHSCSKWVKRNRPLRVRIVCAAACGLCKWCEPCGWLRRKRDFPSKAQWCVHHSPSARPLARPPRDAFAAASRTHGYGSTHG